MGCDIILPAVRNLGKSKGGGGAFYLGLARELKRGEKCPKFNIQTMIL